MLIEIPATLKQVQARLVQDDDVSAPLAITLGQSEQAIYGLEAMLSLGWRIVDATPEELALMASRGILTNG